MKSYIERVSLAVENDVLRDRCKSNARAAREALALLSCNRYFSKNEVELLRDCMNKIIGGR